MDNYDDTIDSRDRNFKFPMPYHDEALEHSTAPPPPTSRTTGTAAGAAAASIITEPPPPSQSHSPVISFEEFKSSQGGEELALAYEAVKSTLKETKQRYRYVPALFMIMLC